MRYHHTQIGYLTIMVLFSLFLIEIVMAAVVFSLIPLIALIIVGICTLLFCSLTTTIRDNVIEIKFGPGLIRKRFYLKDIESCQAVKNRWYYGWGIHRTPNGWLFNVSGFSAVEIKLKSGKKYCIGTDVPDELEKAIREAIAITTVLS